MCIQTFKTQGINVILGVFGKQPNLSFRDEYAVLSYYHWENVLEHPFFSGASQQGADPSCESNHFLFFINTTMCHKNTRQHSDKPK